MVTPNSWDFALFTANLHHFMPSLPWNTHPILYKQWQDYHQPKFIQPNTKWHLGELNFLLEERPAILCLFHLGYHAQIPLVLSGQGIVFDLILDRKIYLAQQQELLSMQDKMKADGISYRFLFSDDTNVLLQARSALRQGRHLIVFADGNSGTISHSANRVEVNFLANRIKVRKGIALLSFLLESPIVPVSHQEIDNEFLLHAGSVVHPADFDSREDYIRFAMQHLYSFLEMDIQHRPYRWESWNYLQEQACFDIDKKESEIGANLKYDPSWLSLRLNGKPGYFDRCNYSFIKNE